MKKLLSVLLALTLCLGIFVSCDNETQTESSSGADYNKTEKVEYYYHRSYLKEDSVRPERCVTVIKTEDELKSFFNAKGIEALKYENKEEVFSLNYILVISRDPLSHNGKVMGYRNLEMDSGEGTIIFDTLEIYDEISYSNGQIAYVEYVPESSSTTNNVIYSTYYDVVLVPKDKLTINDSVNVSVVKTIYPVVR